MPKGNGSPIPKVMVSFDFSPEKGRQLLEKLSLRFEENKQRHTSIAWSDVRKHLESNPDKLASLFAMEETGGQPDVLSFDDKKNRFVFVDCSAQTPSGRRSICYDRDAEKLREKKGVFPGGNALDIAKAMGIEILDEEQYRKLQEFGEFDSTTSSWIRTPSEIRKLGGALFCDRRYDAVFTYHNGADSFYSARGFRGMLDCSA